MGEIKSVKVDNWGVFFLQKLQNFFNKTDYCDLTLQFRDNSQLKVHRLVLSACTDYFNVLEQTCEVVDDAIIMPNGLQADVVVPIVNFMYTGTLEFELKMYNRLLRTAKDMNMTVLLKLLEAHRRTMEMHPQKASGQSSPKPRRKIASVAAATNSSSNIGGRSLIQTNQGKRIVVGSNVNLPQNRNISSNASARVPSTGTLPVRQIGSTTFTRIKVENEQQESHSPISASSGYSIIKQPPQQPTSPFEQLRKGYNNKRPAVSTFVSPPAKKPNLEDVKEFAEQQRMRKQIAAEYGDDDYDASNIMDDDTIHNDDDDDEMMTSSSQMQTSQTTATSSSAAVQTVASSSNPQQSEDPPGTTTIIVKHEGPDKPPTIVVKDNSNSKMNHAKIISEVLRQYPHLVKSNKNIKLKIMPNAGGQAQRIIVKKELMETEKQIQPSPNKATNVPKVFESQQQQSTKALVSNAISNRPKTMQQQQSEIAASGKTNSCGTQATAGKAITTASPSTTSTPSAAGQPQKRRIDSKTMHALIALGAENTTGPWLCLRCGRNGHPISIPSYRGFRRHLINTHKETIDPALCEHCGWRSSSKRELHFHMQLEHKIRTNLYIFPECQLCQQMCIDSDGLNQHLIDSHPDENKQQCIYCNKIFPEEIQLYTHMKTFHKKQALEDGIIDYSDDETQTALLPVMYDKETDQEHKEVQLAKKIKILSDISLPIASSIVKTDSFVQQQEATPSAFSEEYLQEQEQENAETKFVAADGSEVILTAEQRKEILSQLNQEHEGSGVVMVLNEKQCGGGETQSNQSAISHDETSQGTTATNDGLEEEDEQGEHIAEEEGDQLDPIYNEMKSLHSNVEDDSISQAEVAAQAANDEEPENEKEVSEGTEEHERAEHLEESKESMDNLEWAENLISEHDLADEVSSQIINENAQIKKPEKKEVEIKDDEKSQDEISKKLKELTCDWSEDDEDDMPEEPQAEISQIKDILKEKQTPSSAAAAADTGDEEKEIGTLVKEQEEPQEIENHAELLASLQNEDNVHIDCHEETTEATIVESENIEKDDIDMALKSLHKEDVEDEDSNVEETGGDSESINKDIKETKTEEERVYDVRRNAGKNEGEEEKSISEELKKCTEAEKEEKLVKELKAIHERVTSSSTMEVDEETRKGLIDSILSEKAEAVEDTATETLPVAETLKLKMETVLDGEEDKKEIDVKKVNESKTSELLLPIKEEFLDVTPEKTNTSVDDSESIIADVTSTPKASTSTLTKETSDVSSSNTKEKPTLSSEERVKSLISEWADDDDEDEDENDTDLRANL